MAGLKMMGVLETYTTFPSKLNRHLLRTTHYCREYMYFPITLRRLAWNMGAYAFYIDYTYVIMRSSVINFCNAIIDSVTQYLKAPWPNFYKLSAVLKQKSSTYTKFVQLIKNT